MKLRWKLIDGPVWRLIDWHERVHSPARMWCPLCMAQMRGAVRVQQRWQREKSEADAARSGVPERAPERARFLAALVRIRNEYARLGDTTAYAYTESRAALDKLEVQDG